MALLDEERRPYAERRDDQLEDVALALGHFAVGTGDIPENVVHKFAHDNASRDGGERLGVFEDRVKIVLRRAKRPYADPAVAGGEAETREGLFRGPFEDSCTVDNTHPNDLGFSKMADAVACVLRRVLRDLG